MPNVMVALSNIGDALCSTPQSLADAHYLLDCRALTLQYVLQMFPQYGELRPTSDWDRFTGLGHPS